MNGNSRLANAELITAGKTLAMEFQGIGVSCIGIHSGSETLDAS